MENSLEKAAINCGNIIIIAAPSGAGKTTLVRKIAVNVPDIKVAISWTTRQARTGETHGVDYFFVSKEQFAHEQQQNGLLESAQVHENYYGTPKSQVDQYLNQGFDVILEIDCQGAAQVRANLTISNLYSIFILPPSYQQLENRLRQRGTDSEQVINKRLQVAKAEIAQAKNFDYWVVNADLLQAEIDLQRIIYSNRLRQPQQNIRYQSIISDFN